MLPKNLPEDINIEVLLSYFPEGKCRVRMRGLHKRNSYFDLTDAEEEKNGSLLLGIGRNSLYNALPEFLFHPIDRFDNLPKLEEKERFAEEIQKQEQEKENAYRFFAPIDLLLLQLRTKVREKLEQYAEGNKVLIGILTDRLTDEQKQNRFIRQAIGFLPSSKIIRGNKTLLTLMLRKIFMEEGLRLEKRKQDITYEDASPRYADGLNVPLGDGYVGNVFDETTTVYDLHYWPEDGCDDHFPQLIDDLDMFRVFLQDYFFSVEETLRFSIYKDEAPLRLSDDIVYNYLNYNTNL